MLSVWMTADDIAGETVDPQVEGDSDSVCCLICLSFLLQTTYTQVFIHVWQGGLQIPYLCIFESVKREAVNGRGLLYYQKTQ